MDYGNYTTIMSIYTDLKEGERIEAVYMSNSFGTGSEIVTPIEMNPDNGYTRATFEITLPGVHEVIVRKVDAANNVLAETTAYRVFSYSAEYDVLSEKDGVAFMSDLAEKGKGSSLSEVWEVFDDFEKIVHVIYDPRLIFCTIALVLFLLDIAIRKFKFKWIHELVRERKNKKNITK